VDQPGARILSNRPQKESEDQLLLREPPPLVAEKLRVSPEADRYVILSATADSAELQLTISALDVVLHTSLMGKVLVMALPSR